MKRGLCKDIKNSIPMCQKRKYKNTKTQIHKYTNTAYDELLERPNMICIYEKRQAKTLRSCKLANLRSQKYIYYKTKYYTISDMQR